jgi:hypothetical protein
MSLLNSVNQTSAPLGLFPQDTEAIKQQNLEVIPPVSSGTPNLEELKNLILNYPELAAPLTSAGLSLEVLVQAVGAQERQTAVKTSMESLKANAAQRKDTNDKALEEIKTRLEELAKQKILGPLSTCLKVFGMIAGAVAAIGTIAIGLLHANPVMVGAGILMGVMVIDSIVSEATGGKISIAAGVTALLTALGVSEDTAKWIAFGVTMIMMAATVVLGFGASAAGSATTMATQAGSILAKIQQASAIISGVTAMGTGAVTIEQAVLDYKVSNSKAMTKELEAILARLQESMETEEDFLKFIMEKFEDLLSSVSEVVKQTNEAQAQVLSGGAPAIA